MLSKISEVVSAYWRYLLGSIVFSLLFIGSVLKIKAAKDSIEKKKHDKRVEGQQDVIFANESHEKRVDEINKNMQRRLSDIAKEKNETIENLADLTTDELSLSLAKKYGINIEDRKP